MPTSKLALTYARTASSTADSTSDQKSLPNEFDGLKSQSYTKGVPSNQGKANATLA